MAQILNPRLWKDGKLKPEIRKKLLEIANFFIEDANMPRKYISAIYLVGSNAGFNYTDDSDIDIHIVYRPPEDRDHASCLISLLDAKRKLFNSKYDMKIKGHDVEVYPQLYDEQLISDGIYDLVHDRWIRKPSFQKPDIDDVAVMAKYERLVRQIGKILENDSKSYDELKKFLSKLKRMRKAALDKGGEYSVENLVFKKLRDEGFLDMLHTHLRYLKSRELSMEGLHENY